MKLKNEENKLRESGYPNLQFFWEDLRDLEIGVLKPSFCEFLMVGGKGMECKGKGVEK